MPTGQTGTPMTTSLNGKQYIVVAVTAELSRRLVAFRLRIGRRNEFHDLGRFVGYYTSVGRRLVSPYC